MKSLRAHAPALIGFLVSVVLLALALRSVNFAELLAMLATARWPWVAVMVGVSFVDLAIRGARWRLLLSRAQCATPKVFLLARLEVVGLAINNVLPARIGELARAFLAGRELGLPLVTALSSVAVERALDVTALLTLFCAAAAAIPGIVEAAYLKGACVILAGGIAAIGVLAFAEERLEKGHSWETALRPWPKLHELLSQLAAGASVLRSPGLAGQAAVLSLALWAIDAVVYWASARALGMGEFIDYPRSVLILSWAGAGAAVPTAPGGFGSYELVVQDILKRLGVPAARGLGYALFNHMEMYLVVTIIGLACLAGFGVSLGELRQAMGREKGK